MRILLYFFLILFLGCGTQPVKVHKITLPKWYLNPPKSNDTYVYVTGEGFSKKEAILNALNNFVARYNLTISSKFESKQEDFGGGIANRDVKYKISAIVKKFNISNYEVIKAQRYTFDKYLVLVRVNVKKLATNLEFRLDNRFKEYSKIYKSILEENPLSRLIKLKELVKKLEDEKHYIYALKLMDPNFNGKKYLYFIDKVKNEYLKLKQTVKVEVISSNLAVKKDIERFLSKNDIKIGRSPIKIIATVNTRKSSFNLVVYDIFVKVKYKGSIIGSNYFKIIIPVTSNLNGYLFDDIQNLSLKDFLHLA